MNYSEITKSDKRFPKKLREIPDCPQKLYCIGNVDLFSKPIIAFLSGIGQYILTPLSHKRSISIEQHIKINGSCHQ